MLVSTVYYNVRLRLQVTIFIWVLTREPRENRLRRKCRKSQKRAVCVICTTGKEHDSIVMMQYNGVSCVLNLNHFRVQKKKKKNVT